MVNSKYKNLWRALKKEGWNSVEEPFLNRKNDPRKNIILLESITHEIAHIASRNNRIHPMNQAQVAELVKTLPKHKDRDHNEFIASSVTWGVLTRLGICDSATLNEILESLRMNIVDEELFKDKNGKIDSIFFSMIDSPEVNKYTDVVMDYYERLLND